MSRLDTMFDDGETEPPAPSSSELYQLLHGLDRVSISSDKAQTQHLDERPNSRHDRRSQRPRTASRTYSFPTQPAPEPKRHYPERSSSSRQLPIYPEDESFQIPIQAHDFRYEDSPRWPLTSEGRPAVPSMQSYSSAMSAGSSQRSPRSSRRRRSSNASYASFTAPSAFPPPSKPLPAIPPPSSSGSARTSSQKAFEVASVEVSRNSTSTGGDSGSDAQSFHSPDIAREARAPSMFGMFTGSFKTSRPKQRPESTSTGSSSSAPQMVASTLLAADSHNKTGKKDSIYYLQLSYSGSILASKHGNNLIKFWNLSEGTLLNSIKFSSYTDAQSRSREYLIRSHCILSEESCLAAIAIKFGHTLELWNWRDKKCLQTITNADRWTAAPRYQCTDVPWSQLAVYHGEDQSIDLYSAPGSKKKPLNKVRIIHLKKANLPFMPQYPEIAISPTGPRLVAAAGPRPPRRNHPPPDKETLLIAWDISENSQASHTPYRVIRPWQHSELETAIPSDLFVYGDLVISIWIPSNFRTRSRQTPKGLEHYLVSSPAHSKVILVWDLSDSSTQTWFIPNTKACLSPNCKYVAYCDAKNTEVGARGCIAVLDAITGQEVWCWPDRDAGPADSGPVLGLEQFQDLGQITELAFSSSGEQLIIGDASGNTGVYRWMTG